MLYIFSNLSQRLTQLGYPPPTGSSFRVIRKDLTLEEQAGNIEFKDDGIYLMIDEQEYKGYMYLKYPDVNRYGMPKFHITNCQTVLGQKQRGTFDGRYFWHNSNTVTIEDRESGQTHENVNLDLCNNCRKESAISEYLDTHGFFNLLDKQEIENINQEVEVDIFGYTFDWQQISRAYKKEKKYTCENCGISIDEVGDKRFIHVHHKNGNKLNNKRNNLECLCVLCHANTDTKHEQNFERQRMQADIRAFIEKYREQIEIQGNIYFNK